MAEQSMAAGLESVRDRRGIDRRQTSPLANWRYAFGGRRRGLRRGADTVRAAILDWYPPELMLVGLAILTLSVCDAIFTLELIARGHAEEGNPMMAMALADGTGLFASVKMLVTCLGVSGMVVFYGVVIARRFELRQALFGLLAAYLVLVAFELWALLGFVASA